MVTSDITVAKDPGMAPATSLSSGALEVSLAGLLFRLPFNPQKGKKLPTDYIGYTRNRKKWVIFSRSKLQTVQVTKAGKS